MLHQSSFYNPLRDSFIETMPQSKRPIIELISGVGPYGVVLRMTGVVEPSPTQPLVLQNQLELDDRMPPDSQRHAVAKFLRAFADAFERGSVESDRQRADRLEKQLADVRKVAGVAKP